METLLQNMAPDNREAAKYYIHKREIPQLFESITAGMLHHRPENPVQFLQECLEVAADSERPPKWDTFINFTPSEHAMRPASTANSKSDSNASNNASYTPAPISAKPSDRSRASPTEVDS